MNAVFRLVLLLSLCCVLPGCVVTSVAGAAVSAVGTGVSAVGTGVSVVGKAAL